MALRRLVAAPMRVLPSGTDHYPPLHGLVSRLNKAEDDHLAISRIMTQLEPVEQPPTVILPMSETPERLVLAKGVNSEVIMINWQPGQIIPRHNHENFNCWMKVLTGTLCESIWGTSRHSAYTRSHFATSFPREIVNEEEEHSLVNNRLCPASSLHYYMNKKLKYGV